MSVNCQNCHKYHNKTTFKGCPLCCHLEFKEHILCELTRIAQKGKEAFQCAAFNPLLSIVGEGNNKLDDVTITDKVEQGHASDKVKWFLAYAQQQLQKNPEQIYYNLKYHICMVTPKRQKLFTDTERYIEIIADCLRDMKSYVKDIIAINILWLGADHIHIYLESTPDHSVDKLVATMRKKLESTICISFPELKKRKGTIWENCYYSGTIG